MDKIEMLILVASGGAVASGILVWWAVNYIREIERIDK
jgi:hypothetical protein